LVERGTENPGVPSSILGPATTFIVDYPKRLRMNIRLSDLVDLPVFDEENHKFRGYVRRCLLTDDKTAIRALILRRQPFYPHKIMPFERLVGVGDDHLMSAGPAVLQILNRDVNRAVKSVIKNPHPAAVEGETVIGKIVDYIIDETGAVTSLLIEKNIFNKPVSITTERVIEFRDNQFYMKPDTRQWEQTPLFEELTLLTARKLAFATNKTRDVIAKTKKKYREGQKKT
jgi:uncharacterized protein YrrD